MKIKEKREKRIRRHIRARSKISGTKDRPRLAIFRSNNNVQLQLIDDDTQKTIVSTSTVKAKGKNATEKAVSAAKDLAKKALDSGIKQAVFDRGGYKYHGRIKAIADAAREAGLKI